MQLQVVLELVGVHDADDRNAVLLDDELLALDVRPLRDGAEVDAGLGDGQSLNLSRNFVSQGAVSVSVFRA